MNERLDPLVGALWDAMILIFTMKDATKEEKLKAFQNISGWAEGLRQNLLEGEEGG